MRVIGISAAALFAVGTLVAGTVNAASLSFVESTSASGSLDGASFTNALVTFSGMGSTNDITTVSPGIYAIVGIPVTVSVAGVGSDTFTDALELVSNQPSNDIGIGDYTVDQAILFGSVSNAGYDLSISFGPVSGPAIINSGESFGTTAGSFDLTSAGTTTYQATVSPAPEPSSWALMLIGFATVGSAIRSRRVKGVTAS